MQSTVKVVLSGAALMLFGACAHKAEEKHVQIFGSEKAVARSVIDLGHDDDVVDDTEDYENRTVRMKGEVERIVSDRAFVMDLDGFMGRDEVLVFNNTGYSVPLKEDDEIEITGPVRAFNIAEIETEISGNLMKELYEEYDDEPLVVAQVIKGFWPENRPARALRQMAREPDETEDTEFSH